MLNNTERLFKYKEEKKEKSNKKYFFFKFNEITHSDVYSNHKAKKKSFNYKTCFHNIHCNSNKSTKYENLGFSY